MFKFAEPLTEKIKIILSQTAVIALVVIIGTIIDWLAHTSREEFAVPFIYFPNKIIFGIFWGLIALRLMRYFTRNPYWLAVWVFFWVALILQMKYWLLGYELWFVWLFMLLHWLMFLVPALFIFPKNKHIIAR